jgi:hypothetical protein
MIIKSHKKLLCISCLYILFLIGCTESARDGLLERKEVASIATTIAATDSLSTPSLLFSSIDNMTVSQKHGLIYGYSSLYPEVVYAYQIPKEVLVE